jgi:toxin-antitoxin system PIN domain toxin
MLLLDVNVLVYAHREDASEHGHYLQWLLDQMRSAAPFGLSDLVLSGFLRVVTHPRVFVRPTPLRTALAFVKELRSHANAIIVVPGPRHWSIFNDLCARTGARGNLVPDAFLAALAIESGCEWITTDRGFARYPGLRWRHPLD